MGVHVEKRRPDAFAGHVRPKTFLVLRLVDNPGQDALLVHFEQVLCARLLPAAFNWREGLRPFEVLKLLHVIIPSPGSKKPLGRALVPEGRVEQRGGLGVRLVHHDQRCARRSCLEFLVC